MDVMDVDVERTFSPQNFFMFPGSRRATKSEDDGLILHAISSKMNLCGHDPPTSQADGQMTCDCKTALCTIFHRAVKLATFNKYLAVT